MFGLELYRNYVGIMLLRWNTFKAVMLALKDSVGLKPETAEFKECGNHTHDVGIGGLWKTVIGKLKVDGI